MTYRVSVCWMGREWLGLSFGEGGMNTPFHEKATGAWRSGLWVWHETRSCPVTVLSRVLRSRQPRQGLPFPSIHLRIRLSTSPLPFPSRHAPRHPPYEYEEDAKEEAQNAWCTLPPREEADRALHPDDKDKPRQEEEVAWGGGGGWGGWGRGHVEMEESACMGVCNDRLAPCVMVKAPRPNSRIYTDTGNGSG
jgi:hypothetical protein